MPDFVSFFELLIAPKWCTSFSQLKQKKLKPFALQESGVCCRATNTTSCFWIVKTKNTNREYWSFLGPTNGFFSRAKRECFENTNKQKTHKHFSDGPCGTIVPGANPHPCQGQTGQNGDFTVALNRKWPACPVCFVPP